MNRTAFFRTLLLFAPWALAACEPPQTADVKPIAQAISWPQTGFNPCQFNFGAAWQGTAFNYPAGPSYTTLWLGDKENWNEFWEGEFLRSHWPEQKLYGRTPLFYSYIIAFTARRERGLKDCDTGSPNLCEQGATFIRQNEAKILEQYRKFASNTARIWGKVNPVIWLMEPDYFQYTDNRQQGGPMTYEQLGALMTKIVNVIQGELPNAVLSMDISPWVQNPQAWFAALPMSKFSFINTSGGRTDADSDKVRNENNMRWRDVAQLTKLPIIADDGYGVGGGSLGHDATWDNVNNIKARLADGVIAITQGNPRSDWNTILSQLRPQLAAVPNCTVMTVPKPAPPPGSDPPAKGGASGTSGMGGVGGAVANTGGKPGAGGQGGAGGDAASNSAGNTGENGGSGGDGGAGGEAQDMAAGHAGADNEFFGIGCAFGGAGAPGYSGLLLMLGLALRRWRRR
ncbi:MAG: hypothetical protein SF187_23885 [Deltaproteobacteria bacterium]|nr:hypothetical protein [Deltaproteobacteria bacterium]